MFFIWASIGIMMVTLRKEVGAPPNSSKTEKNSSKNLARWVIPIILFIIILSSLFFLSPLITGNAIANIALKYSNVMGVSLFIGGVVGSYFWSKNKRVR